jgi:hypothetical protein
MFAHFTRRLPLDVWRRHRCARCDAEYGYFDDSAVEASGLLPFLAERSARRAAARAVRSGSRVVPCLACGAIQPEMAAWRALRRFEPLRTWGMFWLGLALLCAIFLGGSPWAGVLAVAGFAAFGAALLLGGRSPRAEAPIAAEKIRDGRAPRLETPLRPAPTRSLAALLLLGAGVLVAAAPDLYFRLAGTPFHPRFDPPIGGPRDETEYTFTRRVVCDEMGWHGAPRVVLRNADDLGASGPREADGLVLLSSSQTTALDGELEFRDSARGKEREVSLAFTLPHDVAPGAALQLSLSLDVSRPMRIGASYDFTVETERVTAEETFVLGPPDAGALFALLRRRGLLFAYVGAWFATGLALRAARARIMARADAFSAEGPGTAP